MVELVYGYALFFSPIICCVPLGIPGYSNSSMGGHRAENDKRLRSAANVQ